MTNTNWQVFTSEHLVAHHVILRLDEAARDKLPTMRELKPIAQRAISNLDATTPFAVTVFRAGGPEELHCAFAEPQQARAFASALGRPPEALEGHPGRAIVEFDGKTFDLLWGIAGPPLRPSRDRRKPE